jgi:hypothetical protein
MWPAAIIPLDTLRSTGSPFSRGFHLRGVVPLYRAEHLADQVVGQAGAAMRVGDRASAAVRRFIGGGCAILAAHAASRRCASSAAGARQPASRPAAARCALKRAKAARSFARKGVFFLGLLLLCERFMGYPHSRQWSRPRKEIRYLRRESSFRQRVTAIISWRGNQGDVHHAFDRNASIPRYGLANLEAGS